MTPCPIRAKMLSTDNNNEAGKGDRDVGTAVKVTITQAEGDEWGDEQPAATLKVQTDHIATDDQGEYLPDDEVTADKVYEAVKQWQDITGLHDTDDQLIEWHYEPEKQSESKVKGETSHHKKEIGTMSAKEQMAQMQIQAELERQSPHSSATASTSIAALTTAGS